MMSFRTMAWPGGWVGLLLVGLMAGVGVSVERRGTAMNREAQLSRLRREWRALEKGEPAPSASNAAAVKAALTQISGVLLAWRTELEPAGKEWATWRTTKGPASSTEAFFGLAEFVESLRARAVERGVKLAADERFAFSTYTHAGPEPAMLSAIFQQKRLVEYLVKALLDAQPAEIVVIQRESPESREPAQKAKRGAEIRARDFFEIPPRRSLRLAGEVRAQAFRISFIGLTGELRTFLNQIVRYELPLLIRAVEVEPLAATNSFLRPNSTREPNGVSENAASGESPVVRPSTGKFTVTVEFLELEDTTAAGLPTTGGGSS